MNKSFILEKAYEFLEAYPSPYPVHVYVGGDKEKKKKSSFGSKLFKGAALGGAAIAAGVGAQKAWDSPRVRSSVSSNLQSAGRNIGSAASNPRLPERISTAGVRAGDKLVSLGRRIPQTASYAARDTVIEDILALLREDDYEKEERKSRRRKIIGGVAKAALAAGAAYGAYRGGKSLYKGAEHFRSFTSPSVKARVIQKTGDISKVAKPFSPQHAAFLNAAYKDPKKLFYNRKT
jgi:hypothetical protein